MALNLSNFTLPQVKPLPIFLLLDGSGSMRQNQKIETLNAVVREMLESLAEDTEAYEHEYLITAVVFSGEQAHVVMQAMDACEAGAKWQNIEGRGMTPLGSALTVVKQMLEDRTIIPSKSYRPTIILVSDGIPTDEWQQPLEALVTEGRSSKCDRMAVVIGGQDDANEKVLELFIGDAPHHVEHAVNADQLKDFFQRATMTVMTRSRSANPNQLVPLTAPSGEIDDDITFF